MNQVSVCASNLNNLMFREDVEDKRRRTPLTSFNVVLNRATGVKWINAFDTMHLKRCLVDDCYSCVQ